jgi:hypothetical protein
MSDVQEAIVELEISNVWVCLGAENKVVLVM